MELEGRVALVTGAGAGIGKATALRLARAGAAVVIGDFDTSLGIETVRAVEAVGGRANFIRTDVTSEAEVHAMVEHTEATFGGLDVLVNNAGGVEPPYFPEGEPAHWKRALDLNLYGVMLGIHYAVKAMRTRDNGVIINIASMGGVGFQPYDKPEYGASKAGVMRLTASLAMLKGQAGIRVNCICPGSVNTPAMARTRAAMTPEGRVRALAAPILQPEEIAEAVLMFVENEDLAGRVMIWPEGEPWQLIPVEAPY